MKMVKKIIVDKDDHIIGAKYASEMTPEDFYRVSCLWLTNSNGDILLSKRGYHKSHDPGKWEPAVAGTLDEGETYESNMIKEIREEIGINVTIDQITKGPKLFLESGWKFFCQIFLLTLDKKIEDFDIAKDEVEEIRWINREALKKELKQTPEIFVHNFEIILNTLDPETSSGL